MSLRGYVKKTKPANWTVAFPATRSAAAFHGEVKKKRRPSVQHRYRREAREFVEAHAGKSCPVWLSVPELRSGRKYGHPISGKVTEVHHRFGRVGRLLRWQAGWLGVSKQGHRWIHEHVEKARELGFVGPVGTWNDFERARAFMEVKCA
jgi:hypothetical protein